MKIVALYQLYIGRIIAALAATCALAAFLYGTLLLMAVAHAAHLGVVEHEIRTITGHVSQLQSSYLDLTRALTPARATALGFVAPVTVATVHAAIPHALSVNIR